MPDILLVVVLEASGQGPVHLIDESDALRTKSTMTTLGVMTAAHADDMP